jgi:hypothetical protein
MYVVLKDMAARHARIPRQRGSSDNLTFAVG